MAKLIAVFGATGNQGGSVARALLNDPMSFKVRAVTRNPNSEKAQNLAILGAELVQANLDDSSSVLDAVSGCHGVYGVTNFMEHFDKDREVKQGKCLIDSCKNAGVKHLVFSLSKATTKDHVIELQSLAAKPEIEKYMFQSGIPCTSVSYAFYMENLFGHPFKPIHQDDGSYEIALPMLDVPLGLVAVNEAGNAVASIFKDPEKYYGNAIALAGDTKTVTQMADIMSKHLAPKIFRYPMMTTVQFASLGFPGADSLAGLFDVLQRVAPDYDITTTKHLDPDTKTFEEWVVANKTILEKTFSDDD